MNDEQSWLQCRRAGVLLHITSLPGAGPCGDLGPNAYRFIDFLAEAGFSVWQLLPVGPVHADLSPYNAQSCFAGHTGLLSAELLYEDGLLPSLPAMDASQDPEQTQVVAQAWQTFQRRASSRDWIRYQQFQEEHADWLTDFALFRVLRRGYADLPWYQWPAAMRSRDATALKQTRELRAADIQRECFAQFLFFDQWTRLAIHAKWRGIELFGNMPVYVAHDSADVWLWREYFQVDANGELLALSGVPPDAISDTGQLWDNPLYRWDRCAADGYRWWIARFRIQSRLFQLLRVDHFRGFEACWQVESGAQTAQQGQWVPGPGRALFDALTAELGPLQLVAEDLRYITPEVEALRKTLGYPGIRVLQFAYENGPDNRHRLEHHPTNAVVYTGTHDNDTSLGWWKSLSPERQAVVHSALGNPVEAMPTPLVHAALASAARLAIIPMQDLMGLGSQARMNTPGTTQGNWIWRFQWDDLPAKMAATCKALLTTNKRLANTKQVLKSFDIPEPGKGL